MKITYPGHANLLVEASGFNFMCDPWLEGGYVNTCTVWMYPPPRIGVKDLPKLDFLYISHEHSDHSNPETLRLLPRDIPIYIMKFRNQILFKKLRDLGMTNVHVLEPWKTHAIGSKTSITIFPSDEGWIDSSSCITHDGVTIYHGNDNHLTNESFQKIGRQFKVEIAFIPYAGFSGFPASYEFSDEIKSKLAEMKKQKVAQSFFETIEALNPQFAVPAAGDLSLIGDPVAWVNYFDRSSPDDIVQRAKAKGLEKRVIAMRPGDAYITGRGFVPHSKRNEWQYTTEDIRRFGAQPHVKREIDRYLAWEQDIACPDLQEELVAYFKQGLQDYRDSALEVGDYIFTTKTTGQVQASATVDFKAMEARQGFDENYTKKIIVDAAVLYRVMRREMLWSDAYASCRMRLDRRPYDFYNRAFWRWLYNLDELNFFQTGARPMAVPDRI